jgi:hypothetical protein
MYIWLGALAISIIGLATLISLKAYELKSGKALISGRLVEVSDRKIEGVIDWLRDEEIRRSARQKAVGKVRDLGVYVLKIVKVWKKVVQKRQGD